MANESFTTDDSTITQTTTEFTSGVAQDPDNALFSLLQGFVKEYEMLPVPSIRLEPSPFATEELKMFLWEELERRHLSATPRDFVDLAASLAGERFLKNLPQLDPFLESLATTLHAAFDFYPASSANILIQGAFDFITGCSIEHAIQKQPLKTVSPRFLWFLRYRTGFGMAVALMVFPKSHNLDVGYMDIFPALADMDFWLSACNDLISRGGVN
ncbi:hypothetical protein H0H93_016536 [Arthromyces matolae]|nr:hypothetical protein H0H93_016536 [Arthromyces matolae]